MVDSAADAMRLIDDWERDAGRKAARFQRMAERVEQVSITEEVAGGAVRVTVGHNGLPTDVRMTDKVLEMRPDEIAASVMAAIRKAQSRYPERLAEILAETVGDDDPAAQHILARAVESFPVPEADAGPSEDMRFSDVERDEPVPARPSPRPAPRPATRPGRRPDDPDDFGDDIRVFRD